MGPVAVFALLLGLQAAAPATAQSLRLAAGDPAPAAVRMDVGDVVTVHVLADLQQVAAVGVAAYLTVPEGIFAVVDLGPPGRSDTQPFRYDGLFARAVAPTNRLLAHTGQAAPGQQLDLALLFGPGAGHVATGTGRVATFQLRALAPAQAAWVSIDQTPVRETRAARNGASSPSRDWRSASTPCPLRSSSTPGPA